MKPNPIATTIVLYIMLIVLCAWGSTRAGEPYPGACDCCHECDPRTVTVYAERDKCPPPCKECPEKPCSRCQARLAECEEERAELRVEAAWPKGFDPECWRSPGMNYFRGGGEREAGEACMADFIGWCQQFRPEPPAPRWHIDVEALGGSNAYGAGVSVTPPYWQGKLSFGLVGIHLDPGVDRVEYSYRTKGRINHGTINVNARDDLALAFVRVRLR